VGWGDDERVRESERERERERGEIIVARGLNIKSKSIAGKT
jgi:hypothetical protein